MFFIFILYLKKVMVNYIKEAIGNNTQQRKLTKGQRYKSIIPDQTNKKKLNKSK